MTLLLVSLTTTSLGGLTFSPAFGNAKIQENAAFAATDEKKLDEKKIIDEQKKRLQKIQENRATPHGDAPTAGKEPRDSSNPSAKVSSTSVGSSQAPFPYEAQVIPAPEGMSDAFVFVTVNTAPSGDKRLGKIYIIHPDKIVGPKPSIGQSVGINKLKDYTGECFIQKKNSSGETSKAPNSKAFINNFEFVTSSAVVKASRDALLAMAPKGLFVVEGRVNKDGTASPVGILYTPKGGSGEKPTWMDNSFSLEKSQNRRSNEKDKKSGAIRSKNWHKLVDKRVEMLITPDGQLKEWKTISTARRMGRSVKKFFGGGRGLFKGSRKKVTEAEGE